VPAKVTSPTIIFANGQLDEGLAVTRLLQQCGESFVIAADGGAHIAEHFGRSIDLIIGDMDSVSPALLRRLEGEDVEIMRFSTEKDFTDLELAMLEAVQRGAMQIYVIGALGGRFDQTMANISLLAHPELHATDVLFVSGRQTIQLLQPGTHCIVGQPDDTISLIPIGGSVSGITTEDLYYPLSNETLEFGPARGISNMMTTTEATVQVGDGLLLLVHTIGRA
jgi:thiamine pyrophosphokinase